MQSTWVNGCRSCPRLSVVCVPATSWHHHGSLGMQVRQRVNALSQAFQRRSDERVTSTVAHKLAAGTFALQQALGSGRPYEAEVRSMSCRAWRTAVQQAARRTECAHPH